MEQLRPEVEKMLRQLLPQLLPPQQQSRRIRMMIQQQLPPKKPLLHIMNLLVR